MVFTCPAVYRAHVERELAILLAEIGRDVRNRADEDPRVQKLAPLPDEWLTLDEKGTAVIMVSVPNAEVFANLPDHLHAFNPITR